MSALTKSVPDEMDLTIDTYRVRQGRGVVYVTEHRDGEARTYATCTGPKAEEQATAIAADANRKGAA